MIHAYIPEDYSDCYIHAFIHACMFKAIFDKKIHFFLIKNTINSLKKSYYL